MHPPGRPREFTPDMCAELLHHVAQGASIEQAAHSVGISYRTVQREAKADDGFQLELERALAAGPVDPERIMQQAARTHWRAAAWMLERAHPERYGKRPARSCSPEKLRDIISHLLELALEATPPEDREALYQHMRPGVDQACEAFPPEQTDSTRWVESLATRPTPLLNEESDKWEGGPSVEYPEFVATRTLSPPAAPPSVASSERRSGGLPPDGGIMSPKMHFATPAGAADPAVTDFAIREPAPLTIEALEAAVVTSPPQRATGRKAKALHVMAREQARRARRQASRAKRKGRKAA
jgi:hypothetical protein